MMLNNRKLKMLDPPVSGRLNAKQLKNWRNALLGVMGPWALMMPDEDVQKMRGEMQRRVGVGSERPG